MPYRRFIIAALSIAIMASASPAHAGKGTRAAILGVIAGLGTFTALQLATKNARAGDKTETIPAPSHTPRHRHRHRTHRDDYNEAVEACLRRAHYRTIRDGGDGIEFVRLEGIKRRQTSYGIDLVLDRYGPWGLDRSGAACRVSGIRVTRFDWR